MSIYTAILYTFVTLAAASALTLALSKNVFYSAMYVIVCLISLAGIYVVSFAEFVAVTQILVYAGGVLVIIVFGIMLTAKLGNKPLEVTHGNIFTGLVLAVPVFLLLVYALYSTPMENELSNPNDKNPQAIQRIGISLMSEYVLAFEIAGLLLLVALIGAAVIAAHKPKTKAG
jgi:NADH:ubiquinone oxidoreductase subunit 6 (subunit J)